LRADPEAASGFAYAAFHDVAHVHDPGDLFDVDYLALEREGAVASDNLQGRDLRQVRDDVFGDPVAEIFLLGIVAEVHEGQHADRNRTGCNRAFVGLRRRLVADHLRDRRQQFIDRVRSSLSGPGRQIDALELTESEWRLDRVERDWNQAARIPALG